MLDGPSRRRRGPQPPALAHLERQYARQPPDSGARPVWAPRHARLGEGVARVDGRNLLRAQPGLASGQRLCAGERD